MPKVWIVNSVPKMDFSGAARFGELHEVTAGYLPVSSPLLLTELLLSAWKDADEDDYLLPVGLLPLNALAGAVWMGLFGRIKLLVWDGKGGYNELNVNEFDLTGSNNV